ncbi:hypothetical protein BGZ58_005221 [Dissophora ornata]|nr:hypothetical protein BGZ58_005221 [Dissophora ornata]
MQAIVRTVKGGSPLGRAINGKVQPNALLLQPSKATALHQHTPSAVALYMTQPTGTLSATVQELDQLLSKGDYEGFQQACLTATKTPTKDLYHFLLKTLAERPTAFAPFSSSVSVSSETFDPLSSAVGILTDMNREASMLGNAALQPDRDTLLLLLKVASSSTSQLQQGGEHARWQSVHVLVDAIRHRRLPAVMSTDQWELPDLNIELDQELWKAMFECVRTAAAGSSSSESGLRRAEFQTELDTTTFLMADQLSRLQDVNMDEQLWTYVVEAFGNSGSAAELKSVLLKLPAVDHASPELFSTVVEALANCGITGQATEIMNALNNTHDSLPCNAPLAALARQHAKAGNYEAIRRDFKMWTAKAQSSTANDANLVDMHRSMLSASARALDRMVNVLSRIFKDRQADTLPYDVLPGMASPTQLSRFQFTEATYLWTRSQESMSAIPKDELTAEDYDTMMRISTRLNLLQPGEWPLKDHAAKLIPEMKRHGLKPLKSTYHTLMETMARTRESGASRETGDVAKEVMKVFQQMTVQGGYAATSPSDFQPLIEACFGLYSRSPFVAGQWMYSNQLYPVSKTALKKAEKMMRKALVTKGSQDDSISNASSGIQRYHNSTTIAIVLAGLAHGDELAEVTKRWDDLALQGVERDAKLYQTIVGASYAQGKLARYVLRRIRYEMLKEQPPVRMTPEIFAGFMNCCVRDQDAASARSLIAQCSSSGEIQKTAEWYIPMVRTCLLVEGMEDEGAFLLEEMRRNNMKMDSFSGSFYEFLMEYFVTRRMDYPAGRGIFKSFVKSEQSKVEELLAARKKSKATAQPGGFTNLDALDIGNEDNQVVMISDRELMKRAERTQDPVEHLVERVEISPRTASMLNMLVLSHIRERVQLLQHDTKSGFGAGAQERLGDAQVVIHYLTGEAKLRSRARRRAHHMEDAAKQDQQSTATIIPGNEPSSLPASSSSATSVLSSDLNSSSSSSLLFNEANSMSPPSDFGVPKAERYGHSNKGRLIFVNKYVLGEYIDTCIKEGSPEMLEEADWALNKIMPRVIGQASMAKDTHRLRQALDNARSRQQT